MNTPDNVCAPAPVQRASNQANGELVYAIGKIQPSFPTLNLEKQYEAAALSIKANPDEFYKVFSYQVTTDNQPDLTYRPFLYLAQQATWVLTINLVDSYVLIPDTPTQLDALIDTTNHLQDDYVMNGRLVGFDMPNSRADYMLPMVKVKHLINTADISIPVLADGQPANRQLALPTLKPTTGLSGQDRAGNYFKSHFYQIVVGSDQQLLPEDVLAIHVQVQDSEPTRQVYEFILSSSDRSRYACNIDVTNQYPFVSSRLAPFAKSN
ncbi:hypothetical protein L1077_03220 [Pseudoalteromonas luteoviolacea]|uniref:hypothetical protein n=1 Tax=Pseudoalteromonas luteoviolacea TaxID=43657 RepID=UPI001F2C302C|nr:hypothetical protein [Pseudoalteromonas luteoviolacea]MCF6438440.1 hypothetical protein [Pseudoalteromonas luteoviolacea]